jgi:hypothetical protein
MRDKEAMLPCRFRYCGPRELEGVNDGIWNLMNFATAASIDHAYVGEDSVSAVTQNATERRAAIRTVMVIKKRG